MGVWSHLSPIPRVRDKPLLLSVLPAAPGDGDKRSQAARRLGWRSPGVAEMEGKRVEKLPRSVRAPYSGREQQGEQQSEILHEQIIESQLVLNGDKCIFHIFFSLQSHKVHQAITSLE